MTASTNSQRTLNDEEYNAHFEQEVAAYVAMHPELVEKYEGKWVAVYGGQVIDADVDDVALFDRVTGKHGEDTPILLHKVSRDPFEVVEIPTVADASC